jgi:hypothetical protein
MPLCFANMKVYTMCWLPLLLLSDSLMRVSGASLEDHIDYQACIASPSTCTDLYVPPPVAVPLPHACRPSAAVLTQGSGDRERLDTSLWMAVTAPPVSRALMRRGWLLRGS